MSSLRRRFAFVETSLRKIVQSKEDRYVLLDTLASLLAQAITMFTSFALVRLLVRHLGEEQYGLWATLGSAVALLGFLQIGIGPGLVNALSRVPPESPEQGRPIVSSALFIQLVAATLGSFLVLLGVGALGLDRLVAPGTNGPAWGSDVRGAILILGIGSFLRLPTVIPGSVYRARLEGYKDAWIQVVGSGIFLGGAFLALRWSPSLTGVALAQQLGMLTYGLISSATLFLRHPELRPRLGAVDRALVQTFLREGLHLSVVSIAAYVVLSSDNLVISQLVSIEAVAPYAATMTLSQIGQRVTMRILDACWPMWSRAIAAGDGVWLRAHYSRTTRLIALITIANSALVLTFGQPLIRLWTGSEKVVPSTALLFASAALFVSQGLSSAPGRFVVAAGHMSLASRVTAANAVVNLIVSIGLGFQFGAPGVAWGTVIGYAMTTWIYSRFVRRRLHELLRTDETRATPGQ